jgi:uracil-DNA glycosylase
MVEWKSVQQTIQSCRRCEIEAVSNLYVPAGEKRNPPREQVRPVRLYFVSVAPPWGGAYFWDETKRDAVRVGLFKALGAAIGEEFGTCRQFREERFFLTPAVKCPSTKGGRDHPPDRRAVHNCSDFLRDELFASEAERILALGRVPFKSLCDIFDIRKPPLTSGEFRKQTWWVQLGTRKVPLSGTYFPGNNRHKGFSDIVQDINRILNLFPMAQ